MPRKSQMVKMTPEQLVLFREVVADYTDNEIQTETIMKQAEELGFKEAVQLLASRAWQEGYWDAQLA